MTDTSLRAAIRQTVDDSVLTHTGRSIGDLASEHVADDLVALFTTALATERTAIKAAIEAKRDTPASPGSTSNYYWNGALDAVTQVIDGREEV